MQIEYTISPDDYLEACKLWIRSGSLRRRINSWCSSWVVGLIGLVLIAEALFLTFMTPNPYRQVFLLLLGIYLAILPFLYKRRAKRLYKMQKLDSRFRIELADSGVESARTDGSSETRYNWSAFDKYLESDNLFMLCCNPLTFIPIPKRALTADQQSELRTLLATHLPTK